MCTDTDEQLKQCYEWQNSSTSVKRLDYRVERGAVQYWTGDCVEETIVYVYQMNKLIKERYNYEERQSMVVKTSLKEFIALYKHINISRSWGDT
jgi:hypothetical protein